MPTLTTILAGEAGAAGVQQLIAPEAVCPLVQRMLHRPVQLQAVHLRRAKFKPGRKVTAYYDAVIADEFPQLSAQATDATVHPITVTWTMPGMPQKLAVTEGALGHEIRERALAGPFSKLIWVAADGTLHVQIAPFDPDYPQLARLTDPGYVRELLGDCTGRDAAWTVTPIRYRPRQRHVLRYDVAGRGQSDTDGRLYAKLYANDSQRHLGARIDQLADWLAASPVNAAVLRPLAYLPGESTLLYEEVAGAPLSAQLDRAASRDNSRLLAHLHQAGAALRRLHDAPAPLGQDLPTLVIATECKAIRRTCEQIQTLLPATWQTIDDLLTRTVDAYAAAPQEAPTFVHGDFKADHLLVADGHLTLIDFDSCVLADPAYDIGKFLADLGWFYGDLQSVAFGAARDAFLAGYGLPRNDSRLQRAQLWQRLIGIKIVAHRVRIFEADWAERTASAVQMYTLI